MDRSHSKRGFIGYDEALSLALSRVSPLSAEWLETADTLGRVAAREVRALVDSPSVDASIKDGYAVISPDIAGAARSGPVELRLIGAVGAGATADIAIAPGTAVRILSGAAIPCGATAVLAEEFAEAAASVVRAFADAEPGRNILKRGTDVSAGEILVPAGTRLTPGKIGLLVAGGVSRLEVFRRPLVGLLATGDEVLLPGHPIEEGKLYASNLALQQAWLRSRGMRCWTGICRDSFDDLAFSIESAMDRLDVLITSGGAWHGDRDLVIKVLEHLGWDAVFHRVRMGPGKAVGMGLLAGKPVFCLPGGPPSNETAFLKIALPAVLRVAGDPGPLFPVLLGRLVREVAGQADWTQFIHCEVSLDRAEFRLTPLDMTRRLAAISRTQAIVKIPEGVERLTPDVAVPFSAVDLDGT